VLPIPKEYYLDSLDEVEIVGQLFRTGGSGQVQVWAEGSSEKPKGKFINFRKYYRGRYMGQEFFAKQFLQPNLPGWTVKESIEYQFQNLLFLKHMKCIPVPLFLTADTVGMEFIEGETIKKLGLSGRIDSKLAGCIIKQVQKYGPIIVDALKIERRGYDCSYNNILVKADGEIIFVDFDWCSVGWNRTPERVVSFLRKFK